jgi:two-component system, OmpR family, alkaline phosphatase synthesis response regulator PhoP
MAEILWIEDDFNELEPIVLPLKKAGHAITIAPDAKDAIKLLEKKRFDLILLDILLPSGEKKIERIADWTGLELMKVIRKRKIDTPVIVFTVVLDRELEDELNGLNVKKILIKGRILPSKLKSDVEGILNI